MRERKPEKFVRVERTLRKVFNRRVLETIKREELSPSPDARDEESISKTHALFSSIGAPSIPNATVEYERRNMKKEKWHRQSLRQKAISRKNRRKR